MATQYCSCGGLIDEAGYCTVCRRHAPTRPSKGHAQAPEELPVLEAVEPRVRASRRVEPERPAGNAGPSWALILGIGGAAFGLVIGLNGLREHQERGPSFLVGYMVGSMLGPAVIGALIGGVIGWFSRSK